MEEKCIFRYSLRNAWGLPLFWIEVIDAEKDNLRMYRFDTKSWKGDTDIIKPQTITINGARVELIKTAILQHPEIFEVEEVEHAPVTDGVKNHFRFVSGEKTADITAYNIWYFEDDDALDINGKEAVQARIVLNLFDELTAILTKTGIDESYLRLDYEEGSE